MPSKKHVNVDSLADRILDSFDEHGIDEYDQDAALAIAFIKISKRLGFTRGNSIDILVTTYNAYDFSDT